MKCRSKLGYCHSSGPALKLLTLNCKIISLIKHDFSLNPWSDNNNDWNDAFQSLLVQNQK